MISGKNINLFNPASMYSELSQQRVIIGVQVLTERYGNSVYNQAWDNDRWSSCDA